MNHNPKSQRNLSSYQLKQMFAFLLSNELSDCKFDVLLEFESSVANRICTLKFARANQAMICVNLGYVGRSIDATGCSLLLKVHYCALFIAEYVKHVERSKSTAPHNYFEGLVLLNALEVYGKRKTQEIYSPLSHWNKKPRRRCCMRPIEISCAINSLNKLRLLNLVELSEGEISAIRVFSEELLLYSGLPEIAYINTNIPVYTVVDFFQTIRKIVVKNPELKYEFPILMLAPFEQIEHLTTHDLFLSCIQSDNAFLIGLATRLILFLHLQCDMELDSCNYKALIGEMKLYVDYCTTYYTESLKSNSYFIKDNLFAINIATKAANNYLTVCGADVIGGNIHSIL